MATIRKLGDSCGLKKNEVKGFIAGRQLLVPEAVGSDRDCKLISSSP